MSGSAARLIEVALAAGARAGTPVRGRTVAVGWATVETERAVETLATDLRIPPAAFLPAPDSEALGARCLVAGGVLPGVCALVVLESATEGLLAATLARHDEGPRVVWIVPAGGAPEIAAARPTPGPFGAERLLPGRPADDLRRLLVSAPPGTIRG